jgi:hypothetical protein
VTTEPIEDTPTLEDVEPVKATRPDLTPPAENPHHCPKCNTPGKYFGRQHQSEKYVLIAWNGCECGNTWGYSYANDNLPDPSTLL